MGISRRGNFTLTLEQGPGVGGEDQLQNFEAEWAAQWEPTLPVLDIAPAGAAVRLELYAEIAISVRARPVLRIKLVA
jgi:hypothetical protein